MRLFRSREYSVDKLQKSHLEANPINELRKWLRKASRSNIKDYNAMNLATVDGNNSISSRIVLLKEVNDRGLVFFTNYNSKKGSDIDNNNQVYVTFFWSQLEKQVRIHGIATKLNKKENDAYFKTRNYKSQVASTISPQSEIIESRSSLVQKFKDVLYKNDTLERPEYWGGYLIEPVSFEFWQGRKYRLNDRLEYYNDENEWKIRRLAP